jgi:hypothetical protein
MKVRTSGLLVEITGTCDDFARVNFIYTCDAFARVNKVYAFYKFSF